MPGTSILKKRNLFGIPLYYCSSRCPVLCPIHGEGGEGTKLRNKILEEESAFYLRYQGEERGRLTRFNGVKEEALNVVPMGLTNSLIVRDKPKKKKMMSNLF